jgi:hypothetical protein
MPLLLPARTPNFAIFLLIDDNAQSIVFLEPRIVDYWAGSGIRNGLGSIGQQTNKKQGFWATR